MTEEITWSYSTGTSAQNVDCEIFEKRFSGNATETKTTVTTTIETTTETDSEGNETEVEVEVTETEVEDFDINDGLWTIDLGDGSTPQTFSGTDFFLAYNYAGLGTFSVSITFDFFDKQAGMDDTDSWNHNIIVGMACTQAELEIGEWVYDDDNDRAMNGEIWFKNAWGGSKAGACTIGYENCGTSSSPNWKKERGQIDVFISADFLNNNCTLIDNRTESDDCNNCKDKQAQQTCPFERRDIENGGVFSTHRYRDNGADLEHMIELNPCP